jgi:hypothetical protein
MQKAAADLAASWKPSSTSLPRRGARLADPQARHHPLYEAQQLFSVYVHIDPAFGKIEPGHLFAGREITPTIHGERFSHSLSLIGLHLIETALLDTDVDNARFVLLSDSDLPLYHPAVVYWQLLNSPRSRVDKFRTYKQTMRSDPVCSTSAFCIPIWGMVVAVTAFAHPS